MKEVETHVGRCYEFGPFRLAAGEHRLYRNGELVLLPPKEFDLLLLLVRNSGEVMDRESLIKALWPNTVVEEANLNVHISALRKALAESQGEQRYIETLPRLGYRFVVPVEVNEPEKAAKVPGVPRNRRDAGPGESVAPGAREARSDWYSRHRLAAVTMPLWLLALAFLGGLAVLIFKPLGLTPAESAANSPMNVVPLTTYPGRESQPSFSPDGNQVAFVWSGEQEENSDIYVRLVDGGNWVRLTSQPGDDVNPVWSPDGRTIAFYRSAPGGDGIYLVTSLGGAERKLTHTWANRFGFGVHTWLHWSPDGKSLVVSDKGSVEESFGLFLCSPETGEKRRLTSPPASIIGDCSPAFSPDGKHVAFVRVISAVVGEVYLVSVNGGEPKRLTSDGAGVSNLAWTPSGREIVFSSRHGGTSRLLKIPVEGGTPQWLVETGTDAQYPAFSQRSNRLAWTQSKSHTDIFRFALKNNAEPGRRLSGLITSTANEVSPRYSPDGKKVVFVSSRSGSDEIWVCDSEGKDPVRLTSFRGPLAGSPSWSPDGSQIVFDCRPEGNADIFVVNSGGGSQPRRLTSDPAEDIVPSWSGDGRWIYFTSNRTGRLQVWKIPSEGGEETQLTTQGGFEPVETPDGRSICFAQDRGSSSIWRLPVGGGEATPLFDFQQKDYTRMWAIDREGLYFASEHTARLTIKFFSFSSGGVRTVAEIDGNLPGSVSGITVSPDGKRMLFPLVPQRASDLMMVDNFR